ALGRLAEARDMFDKSLAINPSSSDAWNNRGVVSSNLSDFRSSIIDFDKAIFLNPGNAAAYANKAKALAELERREEALAAYAQAIAISPNLPEASLGLGQVLSQLTPQRSACRLRPCNRAEARSGGSVVRSRTGVAGVETIRRRLCCL